MSFAKKKTVRNGDPVLLQANGRWSHGFVVETTDKGVWLVSNSNRVPSQSNYSYRSNFAACTTRIAHFYHLSDPTWCRDTSFWGREAAFRRERRLHNEQDMQNGKRFDFLRSKQKGPQDEKHKAGGTGKSTHKKAGTPKYATSSTKTTVYVAPITTNYNAQSTTQQQQRLPASGSTSSSMSSKKGMGPPIARPHSPKHKTHREEIDTGEITEEMVEQFEQKREELDNVHKEKMEAKIRKLLEKEKGNVGQLERSLNNVMKEDERKEKARIMRKMQLARQRQIRMMGKLIRQRKGEKNEQVGVRKLASRRREDGMADEITVIPNGQTIVVFNKISATAIVYHGPNSIRLSLNEFILSQEQSEIVFEFLSDVNSFVTHIDISDLALPTTCLIETENIPIRSLPSWAEQLPGKLTPIPQSGNDIVKDLREITISRTLQPNSNIVGLTIEEVQTQIEGLNSLFDNGFICEEEYQKRKSELLELKNSGWCPSQSENNAFPNQVHIETTTITAPANANHPQQIQTRKNEEEQREQNISSSIVWIQQRQQQQQQQQMKKESDDGDVEISLCSVLPLGANEYDQRLELERLETLHNSGFVQETEYKHRKQLLSSWIPSDNL